MVINYLFCDMESVYKKHFNLLLNSLINDIYHW